MIEIVQKFMELDLILQQILIKIDKCHRIMFAQDIHLLTPQIEEYRVKYLESLHRHRRFIKQQQDALIDKIDIKEIMSVFQN